MRSIVPFIHVYLPLQLLNFLDVLLLLTEVAELALELAQNLRDVFLYVDFVGSAHKVLLQKLILGLDFGHCHLVLLFQGLHLPGQCLDGVVFVAQSDASLGNQLVPQALFPQLYRSLVCFVVADLPIKVLNALS